MEQALNALAWECVLDASTKGVRDLGRSPPFVKASVVAANPLHEAFVLSLKEDDVLIDLFPDDDESKGRIRSHRPSLVAHQLINAALWRCAHRRSLSADCILEYLHFGIQALRGLAKGRPVEAPVWVGFGVQLPAGTEIVTPYGILRNWAEGDRLLLSSAMSGETYPERGTVLEAHTQVSWGVSSTSPAGAIIYCVGLEDDRWKRLSLALLLLQGPDEARPTQPWFCCQAQALGPGIVSGEVRQFIKGPVVPKGQIADLQQWIDVTAKSNLDSIAVNRAISMVGRITGHVDALIDGVVVWENLFGTGDAQELGYRVSMNMASVLTDDRAERVAFQDQIKRLYTERSRIVHGRKHPNASEAADLRRQVQSLTLRALRRIVTAHSRLIGADAATFMKFVISDSY